MYRIPIANKYREGKVKRTLKKGLKVLEIVEREAVCSLTIKRGKSAGGGGRRRL